MQRVITCIIVLSLVIFIFTGCGTTAKFAYPADARDLVRLSEQPVYDKAIAVVPFEEWRGNTNQLGTAFLYLIPFMPFGFITYERPDTAQMLLTVSQFEFDPGEDLARAAAYSLRRSGLFNNAFFTYGGERDNAQLLLEADILSTLYKGHTYSYGLSVFGPMLWFIGLPAGRSQNKLVLELRLIDLESRERIWNKRYHKDWKRVQGLYYRMGHDVRGYPYLMQEIMNDAVREIHRELERREM